MSKDNLRFPAFIKQAGWRVTKDELWDEVIILTKRNNYDHIYPLSNDRFGVWLTSQRPDRLFSKLREKSPSFKLEQQGDGEFVVSFEYADFDPVAEILHPAKKRVISQDTRQHLNSISPFLRTRNPRTGRVYDPRMDEHKLEGS